MFQYVVSKSWLPASLTSQMAQAADVSLLVWASYQPWYPIKGGYAKPLSAGAVYYAYSSLAK